MNKTEITPIQIAIRIVIIIIVIAILLLMSFAMFRLVPKVISSLGSVRDLFAPKERLEVTLSEKNVAQDEKTILSYSQIGGKVEGYYSLNYSCAHIDESTRLEVTEENETKTIVCDKPIVIGGIASTSLSREVTLIPTSKNVTEDQSISITVSHMNASSTIAKASTTLLVFGEVENKTDDEDVVVATSTKTTVIKKPVTKPSTPSYYSSLPADLSITVGQVSVDQNARASITFYVTNNGGQNSGSWKFRADLPREVGQTNYNSPYQPSIPPRGTSIMYLSFGNAAAGNINLYIDDTNAVRESNENNNSATYFLPPSKTPRN